jgi:hypothetical protein
MDFIYYDLSSKWTEIAGIRIYIKFRLASVWQLIDSILMIYSDGLLKNCQFEALIAL